MAERTTIRVAAVQATPVFLDRDATVDRACALVAEAAELGAQLVVLPEGFVPTYPEWTWRTRPWDHRARALWARLRDEAVVVPGPATEALGHAARRAGVHLSIGVTERDPHGSSLYNTQLLFGADGTLLHRHRKLVLTGGERLVWGGGDGSSITAVDTPLGRIGTLICWENYMPLARTAMYAQGIDLYLAPTWDSSDAWVATLRHIAREGRVFVIGVNSCIRAADVGADVPFHDEIWTNDDDWLSPGNTTIVGPDGDVIAGPLREQTGILTADLDLAEARALHHEFDAIGHYARSDVFRLVVDTTPRPSVSFDGAVQTPGTQAPRPRAERPARSPSLKESTPATA